MEAVLREFFDQCPRKIIAVYLYGSRSRGTHKAMSDVDVGILLDSDPPANLSGLHLDLQADLAQVLGQEVDLVVLNRAPADLIHRVLRDGKLILDRKPSLRIRFEVQSRSEYFDLLPVLQEYRRRRAEQR
jgi:predicted nucleotidyltransferase